MRITEVGVTADSKGYTCVKLTAALDSDEDHVTVIDALLTQAKHRVQVGWDYKPPAAPAPGLEYELEELPDFDEVKG